MTTSDQFDFVTDTPEQGISLIIPAVQFARKMPATGDADSDSFDFIEVTETERQGNAVHMEEITIAYEHVTLDDTPAIEDFLGDTGLDGFDGRLLTAHDLVNDDPA